MKTADCLKKQIWLWSAGETLFCPLGEKAVSPGGEEKVSVHGRDGGMEAQWTPQRHRSKKALTRTTAMSRARWFFA